MDAEKQRQCRRDDARLIKSGNARSNQLLVVPTESLTNRVWLEWIRTSKARMFFRYEILDLFLIHTITVKSSTKCYMYIISSEQTHILKYHWLLRV